MDIQRTVEYLEKLLKDVDTNTSEIIKIYYDISKEQSSAAMDVKPFLNKSAVYLLTSEVSTLLKNHKLEAFGFILVANNLLELDDLKDDLLNGDVLIGFVPKNTIRKLKIELGLSSQQQLINLQSNSTTNTIENRLAIQIKNECRDIHISDTGMRLYKLPIKVTSNFTESLIKRYSFGDPKKQVTGNTLTKTILLMGATGSGKTTMVNAMINYVLGVEWNDPFRFILVKEDLRGMSQAFSQTREVVAYDIHYREGFRVPYSLTIIDTPGFGDTGGGILHDEKITAAVKKFFEHENGIQELDAVGFVVQSALVRLTSSQTYVFNSVLSIFGKDIEENVRFLVTFADGKKPPVLEAIKQADLPCLKDSNGLPCHQTFNNNSIFESNQMNDRRTLIDWEDGMKNFDLFFTELSKMPTKSLKLTKELLFSREILTNTIAVLESNIQVHLTKMEELRKTEETIDNYKDKIEANKDFTIKIQVSKKVQIKVDSYTALNCSKCETTCHYPCNHWMGITWCPAFWRAVPSIKDKLQIKGKVTTGNVDSKKLFCNVCPQRCGPEHHKNEENRWIYETKEETQTRYDVQARYEEACEKTLTEEELKKKMLCEIEVLETEIIDDMYEITRCWNELKKNALLDDPLTTPEYIQKMIEKEEEDKRPGYNEKVSNLKNLLKRVQLAQNIAQGGDEVYKIFSH